MRKVLAVAGYKDILGKEFGKCKFNQEFMEFIKNLQLRTYNGEKIIDEEFEYKLNEELFMPLGISTTRLVNEDSVSGIIFVIRDRRESKELEQLKKVDKLKDEFLSMVSHELRTPVTVIRGSLERLVPVLMTALTAALALVPLVFSKGQPGKEILYPVALVIVGGLFSSTLLDIIVTPTVFYNYGKKSAESSVQEEEKQHEV
jgi:signal transduction histidine kinase